jgi:hypothetical protein
LALESVVEAIASPSVENLFHDETFEIAKAILNTILGRKEAKEKQKLRRKGDVTETYKTSRNGNINIFATS